MSQYHGLLIMHPNHMALQKVIDNVRFSVTASWIINKHPNRMALQNILWKQ